MSTSFTATTLPAAMANAHAVLAGCADRGNSLKLLSAFADFAGVA
jgi:hypothetical protein